MKSKFPLETVHEYYGGCVERARAELCEAASARDAAELRLELARQTLEANLNEYSADLASGCFAARSHAWHWATLRDHREHCARCDTALTTALDKEANSRRKYFEVRRQHEMTAKLRGRFLERERVERIRKEEHELADLFNSSRRRH